MFRNFITVFVKSTCVLLSVEAYCQRRVLVFLTETAVFLTGGMVEMVTV